MSFGDLTYHPLFVEWFTTLMDDDIEVGGEVQALLDALERHGPALGDPEVHPVVTSRLGLRALRRTPPTGVTPYADGAPVLRVLYGFARAPQAPIRAVVLLGGDKTGRGSKWYPPAVAEAESRLVTLANQRRWEVCTIKMRET